MERHGKSWRINEILQLQRECELLELSVGEIARIHKRSELSILYKIALERFFSPKLIKMKRMRLRSDKYKNKFLI